VFDILDASDWEAVKVVETGRRPKEWVVEPESRRRALFKSAVHHSAEVAVERVASEVGKLLSIPTAETALAVRHEVQGILSFSVVSGTESLIDGGDILIALDASFDRTHARVHAFQMVREALPPGLLGAFIDLLLLDAVIGNSDRHQDNWSIIQAPPTLTKLAPSYDRGSSLGRDWPETNLVGILPAAPDTEKVYESPDLFPSFAHRLPDPKRPDYARILKRFNVPENARPFDLLRETRGRLATDQFSFEEAPIATKTGQVIQCWVAGWRYYGGDEALPELSPGARVELRCEATNPYDSNAVAVFSAGGTKLGFVPVYHSDVVFGALSTGRQVDAEIVELRLPPADASERARIRIEISFGSDEEGIRAEIRRKLRSGELPGGLPRALHPSELEAYEPIVIGGGLGEFCSACGRRIDDPKTLSTQFRYVERPSVYFHYRCFELWQQTRSEPRRR